MNVELEFNKRRCGNEKS